jgi:hypothetical protein
MAIWTEYVVATFVHNSQILPETIMCGVIVLSILLASQPLVAVAIGVAVTQIMTQGIGRVIAGKTPEGAQLRSALDGCSTGFVGKSWARLLGKDPQLLWNPNSPSVFMATIAFFSAWGIALQQIYKDEINAGIMKKPALVATMVLSFLVLVLAFCFRIYTGCESYLSAIGGTVIGFLFGFLGCISLGYVTDRKGTNIWGIPLLRRKTKDKRGTK